jgi:hypothetical protein
MQAEQRQFTEYHITVEAMPGIVFKVCAESVEKAVKKLMAEIRAVLAELQKSKGQTN